MTRTKGTVLVIDDQPGIRRLMIEVLADDGYRVVAAANGYDGLQKAKEVQPQLIFMDMKMPGMDGIETLRELKRQGAAGKVIMMTAYGELEMVKQAEALNACAYITKPFDIITICEIAAEYVRPDAARSEQKTG